jgi:hypothetical protein
MFTSPMPPPRKSHRLRNWLIGIGVAIIALISGLAGSAALLGSAVNQAANPNTVSSQRPAGATSSGGTASTPAPTGPAELRLGDFAYISQDGASAATIILSKKAVSSKPVDQFSEGPQNGYFVAIWIDVSADPSLTTGFDINPLDFYTLSGSAHYDEGDGNAFEGPHGSAELSATTLNAGETASGWLLFDMPSPHGKIVYAPNLDGQPLAYWKF